MDGKQDQRTELYMFRNACSSIERSRRDSSSAGGGDGRDASVAELTKLAEAYSMRGERERALSTVQRTLKGPGMR